MKSNQFSPRKTLLISFILFVFAITATIFMWPLNETQAIVLPLVFGIIAWMVVTAIREKRKLKN